VLAQLRDIVRTRYACLPLWYTLFRAANESGVPTMRPLWMEYPGEPATFAIEDQWLVGSDLLVKPVTAAGVGELDVYFPGADAVWFDALTFEAVRTSAAGGVRRLVSAPLSKIPVYQRGGAIVPRQMRPRRSSAQMAADPYTQVVTLDAAKSAQGELYLDDGSSFDYARRNAFRVRRFTYAPEGTTHSLRSASAGGGKTYAPANTVERIVIAGLGRAPAGVTAVDGSAGAAAAEGAVQMQRQVAFDYDAATDVLTLRKPDVKVAITLTF
jgi:alpha 1,3-glucosidase